MRAQYSTFRYFPYPLGIVPSDKFKAYPLGLMALS